MAKLCKAQNSIGPYGMNRGPLQRQEEGCHVSYNEGGVIDHEDEFENDPKNRSMYREELQ